MARLLLKKTEYSSNNYGDLSCRSVNIKKYKGNMKNTVDIMYIIVKGIETVNNMKLNLRNNNIKYLVIFKVTSDFRLDWVNIKFNSREEAVTFKLTYL